MDAAAADLTGSAVAKLLASCSKATRERALRLLKTWLSSTTTTSNSISDEDLLKIWKGLFYCMWHADKLPVQVDLINRLSSLLASLDLPISARYFEAFLATIRREWSGIDHLRLDKFYLLIRRFVNRFFVFLRDKKWDGDVVGRMVGVLGEKTLLLVDRYPAQGVNYHISQVYFDEIVEFLPLRAETLEALMKPFFTAMETSSDKVLVNKIKSNIFDKLLENGRKYLELEKKGGGVELGSEVEKFGKIALALGFSKKFFASATAPESLQGNRKVLFKLQHGFLKLEKDLENTGIIVSLELDNADMSADAALETLPPASDHGQQDTSDAANGDVPSDEKSSKKKKKLKKASSAVGKKCRSKKNGKCSGLVDEANTCTSTPTDGGVDINGEMNAEAEDGGVVLLDETTLSNLQMQFEKVAAEAGMVTPVSSTAPKKRKRSKSTDKKISNVDGNTVKKSGEKSVKKVRFSMRNNLIWKPQTPLPPQSLRLPPSATPRGSALKKGIPPGPVGETPPSSNNAKVKSSSKKKFRKTASGVSPAVKRLRKLQSRSA